MKFEINNIIVQYNIDIEEGGGGGCCLKYFLENCSCFSRFSVLVGNNPQPSPGHLYHNTLGQCYYKKLQDQHGLDLAVSLKFPLLVGNNH